jgi:SAV_6107-like HEPN
MTAATMARPRSTAGRPPAAAPVAALRLLMSGRRVLSESHATSDPLERYAFAHLAALRAAAAVLADRAQPSPARPRRPTSVWRLLVGVAPELEPWAAYFAVGAGKRAAAEAGLRGAVTTREADDLMRDADAFLGLVETMLGVLPLASSVATAR